MAKNYDPNIPESLSELGHHIADNPKLYETAKSNAFELLIPSDDLLKAGISSTNPTDEDYLSDAQDVIRIAVNSFTLPHYSVGKIQIKRGNSTINYAGTPEWSEGSLKVADFVGVHVRDYIMALYGQVYNIADDVINLASNYKHDWTLKEYTGDYSTVIRTWTLKGCWVSEVTEDDLSHDSNDVREIEAKIVFDRAIPSEQ